MKSATHNAHKRLRALSPSTVADLGVKKPSKMAKLSTIVGQDDLEKVVTHPQTTVAQPAKPSRWPALKGLTIEVEGNIGSGKSTLTSMFGDEVNEDNQEILCKIYRELINHTFLAAFYQDPKKYSFAFQMYMLTTRLHQMEDGARLAQDEGKLVFLDRGAVGDTVFALLNNESGSLDDGDFKIYQSVCSQRLPASISDRVDVLLYLDVDPAECHRRMTELRKRDAESGVPLAYLESVDNTYFHLLIEWMSGQPGKFHQMNIGPPPKTMVLRWNNFGDSTLVLDQLNELVENNRPNPTVRFVPSKPTRVAKMYDSESLIASSYDDCAGRSPSTPVQQARTPQTPSPPASPSKKTERLPTVAFDWSLEHNNTFRRLVLYHLAEPCNVVFYESKPTSS